MSCSIEKKANKAFVLGKYQNSIDLYKKVVAKNQNNGKANYFIAESYRLSNRPKEAEAYYGKAGGKGIDPDTVQFYYAQSLKANGKYAEARQQLDEMTKRQVDIENVIVSQSGSTGLSVILNQASDRAILTHPGLIAELQASHISDALLRDSKHLHVASYFLQTKLQPDLPNLFRRARSLGLSTSLDTNYDPSEKWIGFDELLSVTNVFLPNEREALSLSGESNVDEAASRPGSKVEALAIKLGAEGALGVQKDSRVRVASIPVNVVDTVGAGDSFDAGFIYGYLNQWSLEKSLRLACVCGALSTQQAGGTNGQPTLAEAEKFLVA
jgi:sugar/nucleoside kinase (ribokinase family)